MNKIFGIRKIPIKEIKEIIESKEDINFESRNSSYIGDYYLHRKNSSSITIRPNFENDMGDLYLRFNRYPDITSLVFIDSYSKDMIEILHKILNTNYDFVIIEE